MLSFALAPRRAALLLAALVFAVMAAPADATHFRGGALTWEITGPDTSTQHNIGYTLTTAYRCSFFTRTSDGVLHETLANVPSSGCAARVGDVVDDYVSVVESLSIGENPVGGPNSSSGSPEGAPTNPHYPVSRLRVEVVNAAADYVVVSRLAQPQPDATHPVFNPPLPRSWFATTASFDGCCRLSDLQGGNNDAKYRFWSVKPWN